MIKINTEELQKIEAKRQAEQPTNTLELIYDIKRRANYHQIQHSKLQSAKSPHDFCGSGVAFSKAGGVYTGGDWW